MLELCLLGCLHESVLGRAKQVINIGYEPPNPTLKAYCWCYDDLQPIPLATLLNEANLVVSDSRLFFQLSSQSHIPPLLVLTSWRVMYFHLDELSADERQTPHFFFPMSLWLVSLMVFSQVAWVCLIFWRFGRVPWVDIELRS